MADSYITAIVGLVGAAIGGFTSFGSSWLTVSAQIRDKASNADRARQEKLYTDFIKEASRLFGDALSHEKEDVNDLVTLHSLIARMRLIAAPSVIQAAEQVGRTIVTTYLSPNRALHELAFDSDINSLDPLREFSEACRTELARNSR